MEPTITFIGIALWALLPATIARKKGRSFAAYYFLSFVISPLVTTIIILCLKPLNGFDKYVSYTPSEEAYAKAQTPGGVRQCCEDFRGNGMKLKAYLDDCVDRDLIASSQAAILYKEYIQPRSSSATVILTDPVQPVTSQTTCSENMSGSDEDEAGKGTTAENIGLIPAARFCRNCGAELIENGRFCPQCGVSVTDAQAAWTECHSSEQTGFDNAGDETRL